FKINLSRVEASRLRHRFFQTYARLRRRMEHLHNTGRSGPINIVDVGSGRRRLAVHSPNEKLNTPVQQPEAHGFKRALAGLYATRHEVSSARLILAVHDELVLECDRVDAEHAAAWLKREMLAGMQPLLPDVPIRVDVTIGCDWGGTPL